MNRLEIILLILTILGALGGIPAGETIWQWIKSPGVHISGWWRFKWFCKDGNLHECDIFIKQRGNRIQMKAFNESEDVYSGNIIEGHICRGSWRSRKKGVTNNGVFMLKIGNSKPKMSGYFIGLDDYGGELAAMHGDLIFIEKNGKHYKPAKAKVHLSRKNRRT